MNTLALSASCSNVTNHVIFYVLSHRFYKGALIYKNLWLSEDTGIHDVIVEENGIVLSRYYYHHRVYRLSTITGGNQSTIKH